MVIIHSHGELFMENYIERIEIIGLHGKFDIVQEFNSSINVIFGENGEFKTTLLHILSNFLNNDFQRFLYLDFNQITILMGNGITYFLKWSSSSQSTLVVSKSEDRRNVAEISREGESFIHIKTDLPNAAYFPTFRSTIEAWFTYEGRKEKIDKSSKEELKEEISDFLRRIFGNFVPDINFPSLPEVIRKTSEKMSNAAEAAIQIDQELTAEMVSNLSNVLINLQDSQPIETLDDERHSVKSATQGEIISKIYSLLEELESCGLNSYLVLPQTIQEKIISITQQNNTTTRDTESSLLTNLIATYKNILEKELIEVNQLFSEFKNYIDSLNKFLRRKKVEIFNEDLHVFEPVLRLKYLSFEEILDKELDSGHESQLDSSHDERQQYGDLYALSSGERQIVSLLYAAHISSQEIILIDEPEISLHTVWQEELLEELQNQIGQKQIIVCTHSPSIGASHIDEIKLMTVINTDESRWMYDPIVINNIGNNSPDSLTLTSGDPSEEEEEYIEPSYFDHENQEDAKESDTKEGEEYQEPSYFGDDEEQQQYEDEKYFLD